MTDWTTYARGVHLKPNDAAPNLIDYDYVVAEIGEQFTNNVQAASHGCGCTTAMRTRCTLR